jgi:hypothetical protein
MPEADEYGHKGEAREYRVFEPAKCSLVKMKIGRDRQRDRVIAIGSDGVDAPCY